MELHKDAIVALEYPTKEDKRDFGDLDEEKKYEGRGSFGQSYGRSRYG